MTRVFVVVPAYNEAKHIVSVVRGLVPYVATVIVVNDGSSDDTAQVSQAAGAIVLGHSINRGYGASLVTGSRYAIEHGADVIVHFDADGQHDPADVSKLVDSLWLGKPFVALGSRTLGTVHGQPWLRCAVLWLARYFTWAHTGILLSDAHNGLRAYTREAWLGFHFYQDRMAFSSEVVSEVARTKCPWVEVPVSVRYTQESLRNSKQGFLPSLKIVWELLMGRFIR